NDTIQFSNFNNGTAQKVSIDGGAGNDTFQDFAHTLFDISKDSTIVGGTGTDRLFLDESIDNSGPGLEFGFDLHYRVTILGVSTPAPIIQYDSSIETIDLTLPTSGSN